MAKFQPSILRMPQKFYERVRRASLQQKEALLQFMEQHPEIGNERIASHYDLYYRKEKWYEITKILNRLPGKPKTPGKWQKAWQDWRYNTRKKERSSTKLSSMEERLIHISNNDTLQTPTYKDLISTMQPVSPSQIQFEQNDENSWLNQNQPEIQIREIKREPDECIGDMLETRIIEYTNTCPNTSPEMMPGRQIDCITSLPKQRRKSIIKKKYVYYDRNNVKEIHRITKCMERTIGVVRSSVKVQQVSSVKVLSVLEQTSRTLQSLAESQMRQAEALERQVSLEESRNSILKQIASSLNSINRI